MAKKQSPKSKTNKIPASFPIKKLALKQKKEINKTTD